MSAAAGPLARIRASRLVAVVRAPSAAAAVEAAAAIVAGGVGVVEIAFTTPQAERAIAAVRGAHPTALVGAGTVLDADSARRAIDAGAQFLVSPALVGEVVGAADGAGTLVLPGAATPTELVRALSVAPAVKLFPAGPLGGPAYLRALLGPFPGAQLVPTGGIAVDDVRDWLAAGAFAVGTGTDLCPPDALREGRFAEIEARARAYAAATAA